MKINLLIVALFFVSGFSFSKELSDFEEMLSGFPRCDFEGVYIDYESKLPVHHYFKDRNMKPYEVDFDAELFSFKVDEMFYDLKVEEIFLSSNFHGTTGVVFSDSISSVEIKLQHFLKFGFNKSPPSEDFVVPSLERYHLDKNKTILFCDHEF